MAARCPCITEIADPPSVHVSQKHITDIGLDLIDEPLIFLFRGDGATEEFSRLLVTAQQPAHRANLWRLRGLDPRKAIQDGVNLHLQLR